MIFIERIKVKIPDILLIPSKKGQKEKTKNNEFALRNEWSKLKFLAYSDVSVKDTLIKMCNSKCAYCESKFLPTYPGDVEHFRPKGKIKEATPHSKPGYYWLAADWDNLLLSCRNCNQKLQHELYGIKNKITLGKMDQFPLSDGFKHVQFHIDADIHLIEEDKHRLLINPTKENPEDFFKYQIEGVIMPKLKSGKKKRMAETSIKVYVLQRMHLVQARKVVAIEILAQITRVREAIFNLNNAIDNDNTQTVLLDKILQRELIRLKKFTDDNEHYAGMARQIVSQFLQTI